ncbi:hypothetical protein ElyMa_004174600 [Elysia marginata]|uniref:Calmodulin n=1 Tax=Elysia marginata TaxID=1093978 RepID=A0AAV4GLA3_9GAST|nr:hypothetical protein ElyMa_004174600 [Elysia marginata]
MKKKKKKKKKKEKEKKKKINNYMSNKEEEEKKKMTRKQYEECIAQEERLLFGAANIQEADDDQVDSLRVETIETLKASLTETDYAQMDTEHKDALNARIEDYNFPFENLVFEGGGVKGLALIGALKCLDELGILKNIRRFAGTSAGAITAGMIAVGYHYEELMDFWSGDVESLFSDHSCGYLSFLPNVLSKFGWNPGNKIMAYMGNMIAAKSKTNDPDMTFYDLYRERNVELCIVVTNISQMNTEYCHPKTTPDMPIRQALRMSMSIPGVFTAPTYDNHGQVDVFVDGGVLCNYPIHSFDGWFLSMAKEDAFLLKLQPLKKLPELMSNCNRFATQNPKSLGFLLFSESEREVMKEQLEKRQGAVLPTRPVKDTKLYKHKKKTSEDLAKAEREHCKVVEAMEAFMRVLQKYNLKEQEYIDKGELRNALNDTAEFPPEQAELLFCKGTDVDSVFEALDKDGNGKVAFSELIHFIEERGIRLQVRFQGFERQDVKNFVQFLNALQSTMLTNMKYVHVKLEDVKRTVGINTGHIGTLDYGMEKADRDFVIARGYNATRSYLGYCVAWNYPGVIKKSAAEVAVDNHGESSVS